MRPRWGYVALFTVSGAGALAAAYFTDPYLQALLISIGSALVLFSLLTLATPYMVEAIGSFLRIRTLADAQAALNAAFANKAWQRSGSDGNDLDRQVRDCFGRISAQICAAGFNSYEQSPDGRLLKFRDPAGLGIEWTVRWEGQRLQHSIHWTSVASRPDRDSPVSLPAGADEVSARSRLMEFEERVYPLMRDLAMVMARHRA